MEGLPAQVEVPSYFLCPISMEIMRDPVTLSSGITYDRESIERWVFTDGHGECPMTKQQLGAADREPTPNHTLRRLIQGWCAVHAVERFPTPRAPIDAACVETVVDTARRGQDLLVASLRELADIVAKSTPGAVAFLVSVVKKHGVDDTPKPLESQEDQMLGVVVDSPKESSPRAVARTELHCVAVLPMRRHHLGHTEDDGTGTGCSHA